MTHGSNPSSGWTRLYVEAVGGVAGDMLLAAFIDLGADAQTIQTAIDGIGDPLLALRFESIITHGERATIVKAIPQGDPVHSRHLSDILAVISRARATPRARALAEKIFTALAQAEAKCHASQIDHVHMHEVGQLDSILDVLGIAVAYDSLGAPPLSVGPLPSGHGSVSTSHGVLTVPVPAVRHLAQAHGLVLSPANIDAETITPTGAAALVVLGKSFGCGPTGTATRVGVGAGTRTFASHPNVVRIHGYVE